MSFFKKITDTVSKGVSTATEKAQQTVEITRLHAQMSSRRKELEKKYARIGEAVFEAYAVQDLSKAEPVVLPVCEEIVHLKNEIRGLEERIKELRNEKECVCGQVVAYETKFCPSCGSRFEEPPVVNAVPVEPAAEPDERSPATCSDCGDELEPDAKFCGQCGRPVVS